MENKEKAYSCKTCETEYVALAATVQECLYLTEILKGIDDCQHDPPKVLEDKQGTIALAKNPINRQQCKHVDISFCEIDLMERLFCDIVQKIRRLPMQ